MELSTTKIRYLLLLFQNQEEEYTVSTFAKTYGLAKSTVSRVMTQFSEEGILKPKTLRLTVFGEGLAKQYMSDREQIREWLLLEGYAKGPVSNEEILQLLPSLSPEWKDNIRKKNCMRRFYQQLEKESAVTWIQFVDCMEEGEYEFPFTFYREKAKKGNYISMANEGFEHPARLIIKNGHATVCLTAKSIEANSRLEGLRLRGIVTRLSYLCKGRYSRAGQDGVEFYLPLGVLELTYHRNERRITGITAIKMEVSVGLVHMPQSTAIFVAEFR